MINGRWRQKTEINYKRLKAIWLNKFHELRSENPQLQYIFEKSPPNMLRFKNIVELFREVRVVLNIRNPYANISSIVHRYHQFSDLDDNDKEKLLRKATKAWLRRAEIIKNIRKTENFSLVTYEKFCEDPTQILKYFNLEQFENFIDSKYKIKIKDYKYAEIINMNERQIDKFTYSQINIISKQLRKKSELFGILWI